MKKTKTKSKTKRVRAKKEKQYAAHYLAIILIAVLLVQGFLMTSTTKTDWMVASQALDLSDSIHETSENLVAFVQPRVTNYNDLQDFYQEAANEMIVLFDISDSVQSIASDLAIVYDGLNEFYEQSATELAFLLDISGGSDWPGNVAGVSITVGQ